MGIGDLKNLNKEQSEAVSIEKGPILVIAGAGTGKTRTIVNKAAYLIKQNLISTKILLLTFTRRAAEEMIKRTNLLSLNPSSIEGGTFHSISYQILKIYGKHIGIDSNFSILDTRDSQQIINNLIKDLNIRKIKKQHFPKSGTIHNLVSKSKNLEITLKKTIENYAPHLLIHLDLIDLLSKAYTQTKQSQNLLDYDDLLSSTEELLQKKPKVQNELQNRWEYILVDEYQDTNLIQARLIRMLIGDKNNIMAVGDESQSIYGFRGAQYRNILKFPSIFSNTKIIKLEENYRSSQPILNLANTIIDQSQNYYKKKLYSKKKHNSKPKLIIAKDQEDQSRILSEKISTLLIGKNKAKDIAVLFRANRDSFNLEGKLKKKQIPFVKYGGIQLTESAHIKDIAAYFKAANNPLDFYSWQRILTLLPGIGPKNSQKIISSLTPDKFFKKDISDLKEPLKNKNTLKLKDLLSLLRFIKRNSQNISKIIEKIVTYYKPLCENKYENHPQRLKDLNDLINLVQEKKSLDIITDIFLSPQEMKVKENHEEQPITLSTIHSAKGKEWKHVFIIWLTEGRFPILSNSNDKIEEELRLLYVACTRASEELTLIAPKREYSKNFGWNNIPISRFIENISESILEKKIKKSFFNNNQFNKLSKPFMVGEKIKHPTFGNGKIAGYQGHSKIIIYFHKFGFKKILVDFSHLLERK